MLEENGIKQSGHWFTDRYGSRSGFMLTHWHRLLFKIGSYRNYRRVDLQSVERLVFICKGNTCRSAYAEAVARSLGIEAVSCGLDTIEDAPANECALAIAQRRGLKLELHKTKPIMYLIFRRTDLLVAMEPSQARFLRRHLHRTYHQTLLGLWSQPMLPYVHDPYGCSIGYFEKCFTYIEKAVRELANEVKNAR